MPDKNERRVYKVIEITRLIKSAIEDKVGRVWVEGEISNLRQPPSGHMYFTLKDADSQISAVMFKGSQSSMRLKPKDGMLVRAFGEVTVYEKNGNYQILIRTLEDAGKGARYEQFEKLKAKLQAEGLFEDSRKKKIPLLPQRVGIVTSPTGAAIRDILNILLRRFPNIQILISPVKVQGDGAAREISDAIAELNRRGGLDVMIVGRGGGSIEDLWSFNEEIVARAIAASEIPVISAVGHEIDFTISDFVADLRAPTPSAAAELVVQGKEDITQQIRAYEVRLRRSLNELMLVLKNRFTAASSSYILKEPANMARRYSDNIDQIRLRMVHVMRGRISETHQILDESAMRSQSCLTNALNARKQDLRRIEDQIRVLNPLSVLDRGYSVTCNTDGAVVKDASSLKKGDRLFTMLHKGKVESEVTQCD